MATDDGIVGDWLGCLGRGGIRMKPAGVRRVLQRWLLRWGVADGGVAVAAIPELTSLGLRTGGPSPVERGRGVGSHRASNAPGGSEEGYVQRGRSMRGSGNVDAGTRKPLLSQVIEDGTRRRGGRPQGPGGGR